MTELHFTKGQGTGNDFVLFADPDATVDLTPERIRAIADRRFGVGGDGVIRAVRSEAIPEGRALVAEEPAADVVHGLPQRRRHGRRDVRQRHPGVRAVPDRVRPGRARARRDAHRRQPQGRCVDVQRTTNGFAADLGRWGLGIEGGGSDDVLVRAKNLDGARPGLGIDVGNPHVVVAVATEDELADLDLTFLPVLDPAPGARCERRVRAARRPARQGRRRRDHDAGARAGQRRDAVVRHRGGRGGPGDAVLGGAAAPDTWRVRVPGGVVTVRMFATEDGEHVVAVRAGRARVLGGPDGLTRARARAPPGPRGALRARVAS